MKQEKFAEARDALLKAAAADPSSPKVHYQLSLAYERLSDPRERAEAPGAVRSEAGGEEGAREAGPPVHGVLAGRDAALRWALVALVARGGRRRSGPPGAATPALP